jgi:uncharacterized protein YbdZ (MbtH family)
MTGNLFESAGNKFLVLVNAQRQHSLWPSAMPPPAGWTVVYGEAAKDACMDYIDKHWTDLCR